MSTEKKSEKVRRLVEEQKLFAILRSSDPAKALAAAEAVIDAGLKLIKVTMTIPGAPALMEKLAGRNDVAVGAGSVTTMGEAVEMISRGACFIIFPHTDRRLIDFCRDNGIFVAAGGLTPTEVMNAYLSGVDLVKVYPASAMGGASYIRFLLTPMPFLRLLAIGGIEKRDAAGYIRAGATAIGASWTLIPPEAMQRGDLETIHQSSKDFLESISSTKRD